MNEIDQILTADVPLNGMVHISVPGLRPGDVTPHTASVMIDGVLTAHVRYSVDFTFHTVSITNRDAASVWAIRADPDADVGRIADRAYCRRSGGACDGARDERRD